MATDPWFEAVPATAPLTQGDLVTDCPVLDWLPAAAPVVVPGQPADLTQLAEVALRDAVVLTQACDLEHRKVNNVVLRPAVPLSVFRSGWEADARRRGQNPTAKAWRGVCEDIAAGIVWGQCFLDAFDAPPVSTEVRVVFFTEVHTLPRAVIEGVLAARGTPRLRLRPPYREHLSQSFARFFMRVGLPQAIALPG